MRKNSAGFAQVILILIVGALLVGVVIAPSVFKGKLSKLQPEQPLPPVTLSFEPKESTQTGRYSLVLRADSQDRKIAFVRNSIVFDKTQIELAGEVKVDERFGQIIKKSTPSEANKSGRIELVVALKPEQIDSAVSGSFPIAELIFRSKTNEQVTSIIHIDASDSQVVELAERELPIDSPSYSLLLNSVSE